MKFWISPTDHSWFAFLAQERPDEVDFWHPSGKAPFKQLPTGSPFLFKLKDPHNHIAGGGYFVKFTQMPLSMAWDAFGRKNGAESFERFEQLIRRYHRTAEQRGFDPIIGCSILTQPFFWDRHEWIDVNGIWKSQIVNGAYFDTEEDPGAQIWQAVQQRSQLDSAVAESPDRYGNPTLIQPRLGQGAFKVLVLDAYRRRCAITGESTLPVLEAAHILPYAEEGPHEIRNGMLLRSDFHKLFDRGLITVTQDLRVEVSSRIQQQWFNGKAYYRLQGQRLANLPESEREHPDARYLAWHNEHRFVA